MLSRLQALLVREHLLFWLLVYSNVLLGLPRCHILVPGNVGPLVVGVGLCTRQLNVLWVRAGSCMYRARGKSTKPVDNCVHLSEPGFSEPSGLWCSGTAISVFGSLQLDYCRAASYCVMLYTFCTYLAARLCTISDLLMFCLLVGSQMIEAYSSVGLTKVW